MPTPFPGRDEAEATMRRLLTENSLPQPDEVLPHEDGGILCLWHEPKVVVIIDPGEGVASAFAELVASARRAGHRPKVQDTWIAATARAHAVAVYTQDADLDDLAVEVVRV